MSQAMLKAARELIVNNHFDAARAVLETMPTSPTAKKWLAKLDEIAPLEDPASQWEYLEVFVRASERMPVGAAAVIEGGPATTVDHYYSRLLNDYGTDGWELLSEELQGGDFYRLLFKRPKRK
ncbi:MAG: hypothetical protein K8J31_08125 [Anaerolineae bacterium]|nr:hypothetical protein [Anaerolineae bacterium]